MEQKNTSENVILRSIFLDELRGFAVVLMIVFHFAYDLNYFAVYNMNYPDNKFWYALPRIIVTIFMFCVGISLWEVHHKGKKLKKFFRRLLIIAFWALLISVSTYLFFPERWIYFGTLHCIALGSLVSLPFVSYPKTAFVFGLTMAVLDFIFGWRIPWPSMSHLAMDYIPLFPWWGFTLMGIFFAHKGCHYLKVPSVPLLSFLGRHALIIYVLHQIILFFSLYLILLFLR